MPLAPLIAEKLGRCPRCMGLSLGLSLCAWALVGLVALSGAGPLFTLALLAPAAAFTALFFAHIITFGVRALRAEPEPCRTCGGARERHLHEIPRRQALSIFGSAILAAAAFSVSNIPGVRRVLAQDPLPCEDIGGPLSGPAGGFPKVCVTAEETEEQLKARLLKEAQDWIAANQQRLENSARSNCRDRGCKDAGQRCTAVHWTASAAVNCFADPECRSGRACKASAGIGIRCRCVNAECATAKIDPPVEINAEACVDKANPTKEELQVACNAAGQQVEAMAQAAIDRTCDQQTCPPKSGTRPPCKPNKADKTKTECARVKDRKNCCRCSATIKSVQCKCK